MTGKTDFTEEEWETILEGPTSAGMIVVTADKGGMIRESFAMAGYYGEVRKKGGQSQLLDEIASSKPKVDRERAGSPEELKANALQNIQEAVALVEAKAASDEVEGYKEFIVNLAQHVAEVKGVSDKERGAIDEIAATVGVSPPSSAV